MSFISPSALTDLALQAATAVRSSVLLVGVATLTGCFGIADNVCLDNALASIVVNLGDEAGEPIADAELEYLHEDVLEECFEVGDDCGNSAEPGDTGPCGEGVYVCGSEQAGEITVFATADGYEPGEASVTVELGECHVVLETIELTLNSE